MENLTNNCSNLDINVENVSQLQKIAQSISPHRYTIHPAWADKSQDWLSGKLGLNILLSYKQAKNKIIRNPQIFLGDQLHLSAAAIAATYLKEKKGIKNLYICATPALFQKAMVEIQKSQKNIRIAFMILEEGHFSTICVEKVGPRLKIVSLDALGQDLEDIVDELSSCIDFGKVEVYYSAVNRQNYLGCETFALRDACSFLEDPQFFTHIQSSQVSLVDEDGQKYMAHEIKRLPSSFMKGTQSLSMLENYLKTSTYNDRTLKKVFSKSVYSSHHKKVQKRNYYTMERSLKYWNIALAAFKVLPARDLQRVIAKSLLIEKAELSKINL